MTLPSLQWIDGLAALLVLSSAFLAARRGLIGELGFLAGAALAVVVAGQAGPVVAETLSQWLPAPFDQIGGFLIVFIVVLGLARLLAHALAAALESLGIQAVDQALGLVYGIARGLLILVVLVYLVSLTRLTDHPIYQSAASRPLLESLTRQTLSFLPSRLVSLLPDSPLLLKR